MFFSGKKHGVWLRSLQFSRCWSLQSSCSISKTRVPIFASLSIHDCCTPFRRRISWEFRGGVYLCAPLEVFYNTVRATLTAIWKRPTLLTIHIQETSFWWVVRSNAYSPTLLSGYSRQWVYLFTLHAKLWLAGCSHEFPGHHWVRKSFSGCQTNGPRPRFAICNESHGAFDIHQVLRFIRPWTKIDQTPIHTSTSRRSKNLETKHRSCACGPILLRSCSKCWMFPHLPGEGC